MLPTRWKRREKVKDKRFAALLLNGLRRLPTALGALRKWLARPPDPRRDGHADS